MAVTAVLDKIAVRLKLNDGRDSSGNIKTVSVNLGSLNPNTYDDTKAVDIANSLSGCLSKGIYAVEKQATYTLIEDE